MASGFCFHFACTWLLVGLIWVIQLLVYPQFLRVGKAEFPVYHMAHCWRVGLIIAPLLIAEAGTATWLLYRGHREPTFLASVSVIPLIWIATATLQAPLHTRLMAGFDAAVIRRLILSNWLRALLWTTRGILLICATRG